MKILMPSYLLHFFFIMFIIFKIYLLPKTMKKNENGGKHTQFNILAGEKNVNHCHIKMCVMCKNLSLPF